MPGLSTTYVATAGLGLAMVQGMVGAAISSADGFRLQSTQISSDALKVRPGQAQVADTATTGSADDETIYAETGAGTPANGVNVAATVSLPVLGAATLELPRTVIGVGDGGSRPATVAAGPVSVRSKAGEESVRLRDVRMKAYGLVLDRRFMITTLHIWPSFGDLHCE